ncbi:uncharacterized protein ARMOST_02413 [Armillaria ostoyae]|uniref:Uncharacterized protein n=1 Tax=Armillaria ostoyae TaxID=47428 RepID=A0A284QRN3_ARMOS|nr:uncharacterized protein ARMOST_02413 [Armillaria ostoyae]
MALARGHEQTMDSTTPFAMKRAQYTQSTLATIRDGAACRAKVVLKYVSGSVKRRAGLDHFGLMLGGMAERKRNQDRSKHWLDDKV